MAHQPDNRIRVLVVDDERLSRELLRSLLDPEPDLVVVGECENGLQALDAISALQPELVFLDVQMPDLDGLGVLDALGGCTDELACPAMIFVTAYNTFMKRAFEVNAVDYLEKPYNTERFRSALARGRKRVLSRRREQADASPPQFAGVLAELQGVRTGRSVVVQDRRNDTWHVLAPDEIDWVETDGSAKVRIHAGDQSYQWRKSLTEIEQELAPYGFLRVHRSYLINTARIRAVKALQKGEYNILLASGAHIDTGRTYRDVVARLVQRHA